jgi:hypothetical protein
VVKLKKTFNIIATILPPHYFTLFATFNHPTNSKLAANKPVPVLITTTAIKMAMETAYHSKDRYNRRTTISLFVFIIFLFVGLYIFAIIPIPRIPSDWYSRQELVGVDPNAKITRGAIEAKKTHKSHYAINDQTFSIPTKYISSPTGLPLGNYVVMIDAGSSGSRVYVYQYKLPFSISTQNKNLENNSKDDIIYSNDPSADILHVAVAEDVNHNPIVRKQEPGLSSFHKHPSDAFSSIEPLLSFAAENIPPQLHATTPVYIMATAGLRLISESSRSAILDNLRAGLKRWAAQKKFQFTSDDQADMITGEQEGLYGWIALNYVYNRFGDLNRTYPTGGLDPHGYATIPRLTSEQYKRDFKLYQGDYKQNRPSLATIVDDPNPSNNAQKQLSQPVALLEIGGGSAQVAFAVDDGSTNHPPNYVYQVDLNLLHCDYALQAVNKENGQQGSINNTRDKEVSYRVDKNGIKWPVGGHNYSVYTASFLGHGANAARKRYLQFIIEKQARAKKQPNNTPSTSTEKPAPFILLDPCGIFGQAEIVTLSDGWGRSFQLQPKTYEDSKTQGAKVFESVDISGLNNGEILSVGIGDYKACRALLPELLPPTPPSFDEVDPSGVKKARCDFNCPINDQYQPILTDEFLQSSQFFGFSEYWFLTRDVIRMDPRDFNGNMFEKVSKNLCDFQTSKLHWNDIVQQYHNNQFPDSANEQRIRQQCFKGAWMSTMLHQGHGLPQNDKKNLISPMASIEGSEVQWSLGAVILKMTEKLKRDRGFCLQLAKEENKQGLSLHLDTAQQLYTEDEQRRLSQTDYWGSDAGWEKSFFLWVVFISTAAFATICVCIFLYQKFISKDDNVLYTRI